MRKEWRIFVLQFLVIGITLVLLANITFYAGVGDLFGWLITSMISYDAYYYLWPIVRLAFISTVLACGLSLLLRLFRITWSSGVDHYNWLALSRIVSILGHSMLLGSCGIMGVIKALQASMMGWSVEDVLSLIFCVTIPALWIIFKGFAEMELLDQTEALTLKEKRVWACQFVGIAVLTACLSLLLYIMIMLAE